MVKKQRTNNLPVPKHVHLQSEAFRGVWEKGFEEKNRENEEGRRKGRKGHQHEGLLSLLSLDSLLRTEHLAAIGISCPP